MYAIYTIKETPEGKWRLYKGEAHIGLFDTEMQAREGVKRAVANRSFMFDAQGEPFQE